MSCVRTGATLTISRSTVVKHTICATTTPQVEYALSDLGRLLAEPVRQMTQWALVHLPVIHNNRQRYDEKYSVRTGRNLIPSKEILTEHVVKDSLLCSCFQRQF
ncbi:winged helix-turn-helix transcriptional regulator [Gluconobacter sp. GP1]|uniref:winged helix-turn-helix transcriptional regulator n=1 Tax=Gluconobacter sp. GP1 TaxID=3046423 RepID=UPI0038D213EB